MNPLLSFLQEIFTRLKSKSPKFFVVWQWIFGTLTAIVGLPEFLQMFSIHLPQVFTPYLAHAITGASGLLFFMSKMPVETKTLAITSDGAVIKKTDENKLPFTSQAEKKKGYSNDLASSASLKDVIDTVNK
jgi:hypothetical protein